ncbi:hypothetical protein G6O67_007752 [Ophiocordyceps sinensis]|uniref:Allergen Asp F4-like protein n=2 Tax=Ophiocordyceps sinensis TaxID=72228 RepID=A0A8H4LVI0_9HYPO|nr:allergen Asp F4-like protein [Ophiocordyceps sinensis CO18]KAF4505842.1 hypothetical protein G6O67_007752 [Ophiocordyceps sinensis]
MKLSSKALLAVLLGASAYPGVDARFELKHNKMFIKSTKPETLPVKPEPSTTPSGPAVSVESSAATQSVTCDKPDDSPVLQTLEELCGQLNKREATPDKVHYVGNIGREGNYGCNMRLVAKDIVDKYNYTANMHNVGTNCQNCVCGLKIGRHRDIQVGWPESQILHFSLAKGETKHIAFEPDTQGICGCAAGDLPRWVIGTPNGQGKAGEGLLATTWFEFDFANKGNNGASGIDVSSLVPTDHGFAVQGLQACKGNPCHSFPEKSKICSTLFYRKANDTSPNEGKYAFGRGTHYKDGLGPDMPPGPVEVQVYVDYQHREAFDFNKQSCEDKAV